MDVDISTSSWKQTTKTGVGDVNSTVAVSLTLVVGSGDNMQAIVYGLLGVGVIAPVILLLTVAIALRSRRAAIRRRATYNSAPAVDVIVDAWNSPLTDGTPSDKPTSARVLDDPSSRSNVCADGRQAPVMLSELAVREFFDVQNQQGCQLYVSVEPSDRPRSATTMDASPGTTASSTPGSGIWTSGSESGGEMERRAHDLIALIGPAPARTKNFPGTSVTDTDVIRNQASADDVPVQSTHSTACTGVESTPDSCLQDNENGSCYTNVSGPTVHTVVVDVEHPSLNGLDVKIGCEDINDKDDQRTPPLPCISRMHRSEACYDIACLSSLPQVNISDSPHRASSKSSSPVPSPAPSTSADYCNHSETVQTEDLFTEEEKALKCLDAIAYDYTDHDGSQEAIVSKL